MAVQMTDQGMMSVQKVLSFGQKSVHPVSAGRLSLPHFLEGGGFQPFHLKRSFLPAVTEQLGGVFPVAADLLGGFLSVFANLLSGAAYCTKKS